MTGWWPGRQWLGAVQSAEQNSTRRACLNSSWRLEVSFLLCEPQCAPLDNVSADIYGMALLRG